MTVHIYVSQRKRWHMTQFETTYVLPMFPSVLISSPTVLAAPDDYTGGRYTATFVAGSTTAEVTIPIDDECFDGLGTETFFGDLVISADAMAKEVRAGSGTVVTVDVMDNEPAPEVNFDPTMYEVLENAGYLTSTIVASGPACEDYDVTVATRDGSATCKYY